MWEQGWVGRNRGWSRYLLVAVEGSYVGCWLARPSRRSVRLAPTSATRTSAEPSCMFRVTPGWQASLDECSRSKTFSLSSAGTNRRFSGHELGPHWDTRTLSSTPSVEEVRRVSAATTQACVLTSPLAPRTGRRVRHVCCSSILYSHIQSINLNHELSLRIGQLKIWGELKSAKGGVGLRRPGEDSL